MSGHLNTHGKRLKYGRVEVCAKLPQGDWSSHSTEAIEGRITINDLVISEMGLSDLHSKFTIIPHACPANVPYFGQIKDLRETKLGHIWVPSKLPTKAELLDGQISGLTGDDLQIGIDFSADAEPWTSNFPILDGSSSISEPAATHEAKRTSIILNCVSSSLPMLTTWVATGIQDAFYDAFHAENTCQAGLILHALTVNGKHVYQRNFGLELLILQAKMCHAQAEIDLYTVAIENAHKFDCSTTNKLSSYSGFIPPPRPDELCYYEADRDSMTDDFDDFEFE
ncbi:hypothetical protein F4604DRAFT_1914955 [Suillus subluteus]|nr:hypothetical protein F4604DRAFT_1914955 [Suillus subluteus]